MVSAPASGLGMTLLTAALARLHRDAGRRVRVFKCGPDFLDPMILERASGAPVYQLDLFMVGEEECRRLLHEAASAADVILVEGAMGLYDGNPSAADLAQRFGLPVLAVIDASGMAQTFGAVAHGLASYRPEVRVAAVLANRVGSAGHGAMLEAGLPDGVQWLGALQRDAELALPERHLGLVQASEIADLEARIARAAAALPPARPGSRRPPASSHPRTCPWIPRCSRASASPWPATRPSPSSIRPTSRRSPGWAPNSPFSRRCATPSCPNATRSGCLAAIPNCISRRWQQTAR
jgi:cobyrinic acid a,c-diamide synthase